MSCSNALGNSVSYEVMMPDSKRRSRLVWLISLALVVVTFALYWPVRHYDFVEYDDPEYVFENPAVCRGISWYGLAWSVVDAHASNWHPITWLSHMLDCQLFGLQPGAHHLVNVLLHCANSALLFLLLRTMTGAVWRSALVAALFAWHPLRVESVAWIAERKDVLSGFFFLLTLFCYAKYAAAKPKEPETHQLSHTRPASDESHQPSARRPDISARWYYLTLVCFALGLLSKPMLVTVPCVLLLLDYWPLSRIPRGQGSPLQQFRVPAGLLLEKAPFLMLSMGVAWLTVLAQRSALVSFHSDPAGTRLATLLAGYFGYLEKIFWPQHLCVLYLRPQGIPIGAFLGGLVVLLGVSGAVFLKSRSKPYLAVGWLWFLGMLLPVSGLFQTGLQSIADRYTYLPAIGLGLMVAWGLGELAAAVVRRRVLICGLVASCLVGCAVLTRFQLAYWQNTQTLMGHALELDPNNYVAHQDLARFYSKAGQTELAHSHRELVRVLDPSLRSTGQTPAP